MKKIILLTTICLSSIFASPVFEEEIPVNSFEILGTTKHGKTINFITEDGNYTLEVTPKEFFQLLENAIKAKVLISEDESKNKKTSLIFTK